MNKNTNSNFIKFSVSKCLDIETEENKNFGRRKSFPKRHRIIISLLLNQPRTATNFHNWVFSPTQTAFSDHYRCNKGSPTTVLWKYIRVFHSAAVLLRSSSALFRSRVVTTQVVERCEYGGNHSKADDLQVKKISRGYSWVFYSCMAALPLAGLAVCRLWDSPVHRWAMPMGLALPPDSSQSANRVSTSFCFPSWLQQEMVTTQVYLLRANVRQVTWCLLCAAEEQPVNLGRFF